MSEQRIVPDKVTKPIQLLAAWLVGLILVNGSFLLAAEKILNPSWAGAVLVIAAVVNVPVFIGALFLLQTKFRPQMQEDLYYAQYLEREKSYSFTRQPSTAEVVEKEIAVTANKIVKSLGTAGRGQEMPIADILRNSQQEILIAKYGSTRTLSELYESPESWVALVDKWSKSPTFTREVDSMIEDGLIVKRALGYRRCKLTDLGLAVAKEAAANNNLFSQKKPDFWQSERIALLNEVEEDEEAA